MTRFKNITIIFLFVAGLLSSGLLSVAKAESFDPNKLQGTAEDLWGNKIDLSKYDKGVVLIHPFSPANCGYCLVDGEFIKENYFKNNEKMNGRSFHQCLFNPQLDIYSYLKHYREASAPVLTFPAELHGYHRDGFPFMVAFRDGKRIYRGPIGIYTEDFESLRTQLWQGKDVPLKPTSPIHMTGAFIRENRTQQLGVEVYSDKDEEGLAKGENELKRIEQRVKEIGMWKGTTTPYAVKKESQLSDEDRRKNLSFKGITEQFSFKLFDKQDIPIKMDANNIQIGDYNFPKADVGVFACFPNPFNKERYAILNVRGSNVKNPTGENWVDYGVYKDGADGKPEILLHGFFEKNNGNWKFSPSLAYGTATTISKVCKEGVCPAPGPSSDKSKNPERSINISGWADMPNGKMKTLGTSACRFPSMAVDNNAICWVAWEEKGDIFLTSVNRPESQITKAIENDSSDSFNPIIASDGSMLWICYLNDRHHFYQLKAKHFDGNQLSDEIAISEEGPFDVITPAASSNQKGKLIVAWSEWKANQRFLRYRVIENRTPGKIHNGAICTKGIEGNAAGYVCAWYPSLIMNEQGQFWGTWNQHYPSVLGVCMGNLKQKVTSVTKNTGNINTNENGGYPSIVIDKEGRKWVFWESFGWDIALSGTSQKIFGSYYNEESKPKKWILPYTLTLEEQTAINQTPKAVVDEKGTIWVVWSGRKNDIKSPWGIYIAHFSDNKWSSPKLISQEGVNCRAPAIGVGKDAKLWISWHYGTGENMKIAVLEYITEANSPKSDKTAVGATPTVSQSTPAKDVTATGFAAAAMRHIEKLASIGCRAAGSPKEAEALEYIEIEMKQMGLSSNRESFTFSSYSPEELQLEAGSQRYTPVSVCFDPYASSEAISGPATYVTPPSNPGELANLKLADTIAITAARDKSSPKMLLRTQFMLALKKPKAIVLLSDDDFNRCRNLAGTATLHAKGRIDTLNSANLMATIPASSQTTQRILVSAHYDCTDGPGAADNASGVAMVLEIARYFQQKTQKPGMQLDFAVFAAEECGNLGAKAFLTRHGDTLNQYEMVFNIDTLCGNEEKIYIEMRGGVENASPKKGTSQIPAALADKAILSGGKAKWTWLKPEITMLMASCVPPWLADEIKSASAESNCPIIPANGMGSDHTIFAQAGIPATNIANSGCATHGSGDTPDKINPERLRRAAELVIRVLEKTMADRASKQ